MSSKESVGVYLLHNPNTDETYVGSGIINERKNLHFRDLKNNKHINKKLQNAFNKDPNFDFVCVETIDRNEAYEFEQSIIDEFKDSDLLLNIAHDVRGSGVPKHSEETKKLMSKNISKTRQSEDFINKTFKNKEWKNNLSEKVSSTSKKNWENPEFKEKMRCIEKPGNKINSEIAQKRKEEKLLEKKNNPNISKCFGQKRSEEFSINNSNKIKDKWQDPVYREKQLKAREGKMTSFKTPIVGDGVIYDSLTSAAQELNISKQSIKYRVNSSNFPNWRKINE